METPSRLRGTLGKIAPSARRGNRGNTAVEFALVLLLLLGLIFGIFEIGRLFYIQLTVHAAVREASRFTVTGNTLPDPNNQGQVLSRMESIVARLKQTAPGINVDSGNITIIGPNGVGDPGGPGDLVTIRADYDIHLITPIMKPFFPGGVYHYSVSIVSKNESF
jgi:hypothetical protein